nr:NAD(P)-binding domain-containing protein [Bacteroidota bacterium]
MTETNTLIIGASIAGLACAGALSEAAIDYLIIEKEAQIVSPWRNHYDRLHLHTNKSLSNLPYKKFYKKIPRYPGRLQVIEYLENYKMVFNINPVFNTEATLV